MKKVWTKEMDHHLKQMYLNHPIKYCAEGLGMGYIAVKSRISALKLKHAPGYSKMANTAKSLTAAEINFIKANYLKYPNPVLSKMMGRGESTLVAWRKKLGIEGKVNTGRIQKGNVSWNKGKKMPAGWCTEGMKRTQFKKGSKPHNTKFDGATGVRKSKGRPYIWLRIENKKWKELHRVVWEQTMGEIPKGFNVQFKYGNSLNCEPSNLYIINRHNQMQQNSIHRYDPELKSLIFLSAKLKRKIKSYEKQD